MPPWQSYRRVPGPIRITPSREQAGQRIDRLLAETIGTISRSRVKALIDEGALSRTAAAARPDAAPRPEAPEHPSAGATLVGTARPPEPDSRQAADKLPAAGALPSAGAVSHSDIRVTEPAEPARAGVTYTLILPEPAPAAPQAQAIAFPILYEDRDLIVLDKPAGLVVHPAPGNRDGTLVNALLAHCGPGFTGIGAEKRPGIVHRLDKDTSGVMVVAKTQLANDVLTPPSPPAIWSAPTSRCAGALPTPLSGEIEGAIGRDRRDRKRMAVVSHGGKAALTRYKRHTSVRRRRRLWWSAAWPPAGPIRSASIWRPAAIRLLAIRSICGRIPADAKGLPEPSAAPCSTSPVRPCTPPAWALPTRGPARRCGFETPPPADMAALIALLEADLPGQLTG